MTEKTPLGVNIHYFLKWTVISIVVGSLGGLTGGLFSKGVALATNFRLSHDWTLYFLPVGGIVIVFLYQFFHEGNNKGTNMVIESISSNEEVTPASGPLIFISTIITHLVGGSSGREGAALQLGACIGNVLGKAIRLDEKDKKVAIMCGMSTVFAALFGTPLAAAVFSMEVISIGIMYYAALMPCLFSALIGASIAKRMGIPPEAYHVADMPVFSVGTVSVVVILAVLCAVVSILFCVMLHKAHHLYRHYFKNPYIRILTASAILILITLLSGTRDYNGSSMALIENAMEGSVRYEAFFMKMIFTAVTLSAGFKGGEIVPTLCVGATFGCAFGNLFGFSPALCAACGMAAMFAGVTNCPVSTMLIALELFGAEGMAYYAVAVAVSFTLSGYYSLYSSQKFVYSKVKTEFVNQKSK